MNKASVWSSRADVLNDLKEVTGGNPGISDLDDYVAVGERPPPDRRESIDEDEVQQQFGVLGSGPEGSTGPDLNGISKMLQLVNEDPYIDNEPKTVFRNTMTDKISISKLNPNVMDFVPTSVRRSQPRKKLESPKKSKLTSPKKLDHSDQSSSKVDIATKVSNNKICDEKKDEAKTNAHINLLVGESNSSTINESGKHNQKIVNMKSSASESMNSLSKATVSSDDISLEKKVDISNMKSEEIEEVKLKIKSKIIDSSGNSIKQKKEKNVAIAALLRLYATAPPVPAEKPVKLITPDYFKTLPTEEKTETKEQSDVNDVNATAKTCVKATSTSSSPVVYKDPFVEESIAKVNNWFDNEDSPKPKPLPVQPQPPAAAPVPLPPVQFKDVLSFKKKNASSLSINSRKSETNSEKKKQFTAFVPSSYANDLLQKYEKNAESQVAPRVDWGEALERRLMEKDKEIKKKMRDAQDGSSPNSVAGNENSA